MHWFVFRRRVSAWACLAGWLLFHHTWLISQDNATVTSSSPASKAPANVPMPAAKQGPGAGSDTASDSAAAQASPAAAEASQTPPAKASTEKSSPEKKASDPGAAAQPEPAKAAPETEPAARRLPFLELLEKKEAPGPLEPSTPTWFCAEENSQWVKDGYNYARRLDILIRIFNDRLKNNRLSEVSLAQISATHLMNLRLGRVADNLLIAREPAGADLKAHNRNYTSAINVIVTEYTKLPDFPRDKIREQADQVQKNLQQKVLPSIVKMIDAKQYTQADEKLDACYDAIDYFALWLFNDRQRLHKPFGDQRQKYRNQLVAEYRKVSALEWRKKQLAVGQDSFTLVSRVDKASTSLSRGTTVEWNGRTLTGPELLDTVRREWLAEMPELARITAYAALMLPPGSTENIGVSANEVLIGPTREYSKFMPDMIKALAAVIDRDAADCPVDDVPALYAAYLRSVAGIAAELPDHAGPLEKPLDLLARRNETFYNEQVLKYRAITTPMLEFRQTWALAVYRENASEMRSISEVFRGAFLEDAKLGDGFVRKANSSAGYFSTLDPVLPTLRRRGQRPLQQPAIFNRVVADKATPDLLFAPLEEGCVALLAAPTSTAAIQKQLAALRRDLLVDEKNPPLTLPAALAIWKAEQGFWNAAGADIESYHVDTSHSLLVRVAYDEPNFAHLDRLPLPGDLGQLFLRVRCSPPYWLYHDHFFCDLYTE